MSALWVLVALSAYVLVALLLRQRFAVKADSETILVELPTVGHYLALHHVQSPALRFREPVLLCHGLGANRFNLDFVDDGDGSDRLSIARTLARQGFDVWVVELRGRGQAKVPPRTSWCADDEVAEELPTAIETVLELTGAPKVFWLGHSWGGLVQYLFHSRGHPLTEKMAGLITVGSPGHPRAQRGVSTMSALGRVLIGLLGFRLPFKLLAWLVLPVVDPLVWMGRWPFGNLASMPAPMLRRLLASLPEDIGSGVGRQLLSWAKARRFYSRSGWIDEDHYDRLKLPLLLLAGSHDFYLAPPESVAFVAERAGSTDKTFRVFGRAYGETVDYGHGGLLVGKQAPDEVFPVISAWLEQRATKIEAS